MEFIIFSHHILFPHPKFLYLQEHPTIIFLNKRVAYKKHCTYNLISLSHCHYFLLSPSQKHFLYPFLQYLKLPKCNYTYCTHNIPLDYFNTFLCGSLTDVYFFSHSSNAAPAPHLSPSNSIPSHKQSN